MSLLEYFWGSKPSNESSTNIGGAGRYRSGDDDDDAPANVGTALTTGARRVASRLAPSMVAAPREPPKAKDAIEVLHKQIRNLELKEKQQEAKVAESRELAKTALKQKRTAEASRYLNNSKIYEKGLAVTRGHITNLNQNLISLENASLAASTVDAMSTAAASMRTLHKEMPIERVDNVIEDVVESMKDVNDVSVALSQPIGDAENFDEEALAKELDRDIEEDDTAALESKFAELEASLGDLTSPAKPPSAKPPATRPVPNMPAVPTAVPVATTKKKGAEEEEFARLEREMTMEAAK